MPRPKIPSIGSLEYLHLPSSFIVSGFAIFQSVPPSSLLGTFAAAGTWLVSRALSKNNSVPAQRCGLSIILPARAS